MRKLENVVVGVDFSQHSEDALAQALRIARHDASELHVLHVVEDLVASDLAELFDVPEDEIRGEVLRNAQTHVEKIVSAARHKTAQVSGDDGFEANIHVDVIIGNPCVEILRCVRDVSADLLVLGSSGSSESVGCPGALAVECIQRAPAEVMLVGECDTTRFHRIVACVDFSETSHEVVEKALWIARAEHAELHVLHVYRSPWVILHDYTPKFAASSDFQQRYKDRLTRRMESLLAAAEPEIHELHVQQHLVEAQNQDSTVIRFINSVGAELVVLGTPGLGGFAHPPMETTAERIVRDTRSSVLVTRSQRLSANWTGRRNPGSSRSVRVHT